MLVYKILYIPIQMIIKYDTEKSINTLMKAKITQI